MIERGQRVVPLAVRPMKGGDIDTVAEIEKLCFGDRWTASAFQAELDNPSSTYVVAVAEGRVVGYAGFWLILEEAHITTIAVQPSLQGQKIGERLLLRLIKAAADKGAKWMTLEVRVSNQVAQRLYEKYGFSSLGKRRGYYQDDGEDALVMWTENIWQDNYQARLKALQEQFDN
ncbi:MAG: ribosomal protein S18-alanine N-acetyltransferase [Cyanobacteria bacterium REEB65]|nr:ribosomal protein S18-alanine N-acetyltransferase [Cyanobacteria bacterium REEB65]